MIPPLVRWKRLRAMLLVSSWCPSGTGLFCLCPSTLHAPPPKIFWNDQRTPLFEQMHPLRDRSEQQGAHTKDLALQIRKLSATPPNKTRPANGLANLAAEGDPGHDTLQEVATTPAPSLYEQPVPADSKDPPMPHVDLAPNRISLWEARRGEFLSML
jgi:hypothetical protein